MRSENCNSQIAGERHVAPWCAILVSVVTVLAVTQANAIITANSSTWEGSYEGNALPSSLGWGAWWDGGPLSETNYVSVIDADTHTTTNAFTQNYALHLQPANAEWYSAPAPVAFDFATGASIEMRILGYFGTVNQQTFIEAVDSGGGGTNSVRIRFKYTGANPDGEITVNNSAPYPFHLRVADGFHVFRATVSGTVVNVYADYNDTPIITTTTISDTVPNKFGFGNSIITSDFDYVRWTTAGAFVQLPEPSTAWLVLVPLLAFGRRLLRRK